MINTEQNVIPAITVLDSLKRAVQQELEKKRRLGHYYVTDENGQIIFQGDDAPLSNHKGNE